MQHDRQGVTRALVVLAVFILALGLLSVTAFANKEAKTYPEEGKIVATGLNEWVINRQHQYSHTLHSCDKHKVLSVGVRPSAGLRFHGGGMRGRQEVTNWRCYSLPDRQESGLHPDHEDRQFCRGREASHSEHGIETQHPNRNPASLARENGPQAAGAKLGGNGVLMVQGQPWPSPSRMKD